MNTSSPPSLTKATSESYLRKAAQLMLRVKKDGFDEAISWLSSLTGLRPATFRQYRACLVHYHEVNGYPVEDVEALRSVVRQPSAAKLPLRSSALRRRSMPPKATEKLFAELAKRRSKTARHLELWLRASEITGHRPTEWSQSLLLDEGKRVKINNAKSQDGKRAHGPDRILELSLSPDEQVLVNSWAAVAEEHAPIWARFLSRCQRELRRAAIKAFGRKGRTITLYSPRHQFAADLKKAGATKDEVAAGMGHRGRETAGLHYGRKKDGKAGGSRAKPSQRDVQRVKDLNPEVSPAPAETPVSIKPPKPEGPSFG